MDYKFDKGKVYVKMLWVGKREYLPGKKETREYDAELIFDQVPTEDQIKKAFINYKQSIIASPDWSNIQIVGYAIYTPTIVKTPIDIKNEGEIC